MSQTNYMCCMNGYWGCDKCFDGGKPIRDIFIRIYQNYSPSWKGKQCGEAYDKFIENYEKNLKPVSKKFKYEYFQTSIIQKIKDTYNNHQGEFTEDDYLKLENEIDSYVKKN